MKTKPTIKNLLIVIIPVILVLFVIFFLAMPKEKENKNNPFDKINDADTKVLTPEVLIPEDEVKENKNNSAEKNYDADAQALTLEAMALKIAKDSEDCSMAGVLTDKISYNDNSKTWWIDLELMPESEKKGCNPACVVNVEEITAEVNWRCTGLIVPEE